MQEGNEKINPENLSQLKWACRRGMLELDILLGNFLDEKYSNLTLAEKQTFIVLLSSSDPELFSWLLGNALPVPLHFKKIVEMIRDHARTRF